MKTKINKDAFDFMYQNGTVVNDEFMMLPFWLEIIDKEQGIVVFHSFENAPEHLKDLIITQREL